MPTFWHKLHFSGVRRPAGSCWPLLLAEQVTGVREDINHAIEWHAKWRAQFRDFMHDRVALDAEVMGLSDQCEFGRWLAKEGQKLLSPAALVEISKLHAEFHSIAADVIRKKQSGNVRGAE